MGTLTNLPVHFQVNYTLNVQTGYYEKQPHRIAFNKLPFELKVEETHEQRLRDQGADEIIHGRIKNGKYQFFTGLIPVEFAGCFFGNDYKNISGNKIISLVVFEFCSNDRSLVVYYFNNYYKHSRVERIAFVSEFLQTIKQR
jgi:hypothetical protein